MNNDLPDLPEPSDLDGARWGYTADDMRNHAIDAYNAGQAAGREHFLRAREWAERCGAAQAEADKMAKAISHALHWIEAMGAGDVPAAQQLRSSIGGRLADAKARYVRLAGA
jgi:hypothetical protein